MNAEQLPLVSVVIPAHNSAPFLARALDSVLAQDYPAAEIIVIDDGSTDGTAAVAQGYGAAVRYLHQHNQGAAAARNRGIREARGELISFLDADDEYLPGRLRRCVEALQGQPAAVAAFCRAWNQPESGPTEIRGERVRHLRLAPGLLWPSAYQCTPGTICRKSALERVGGFVTDLQSREDQQLWICLGEIGPIVEVPQPLIRVHTRRGSLSASTALEQICADYYSILERAFVRAPERYNPQRALIYADTHFFMGMNFLIADNRRRARDLFRQSLRAAWSWRAFGALLTAYVPRPAIEGLRRFNRLLARRRRPNDA